jgi:hypothetical protein
MLSKIDQSNYNLGTNQIKKYIENNKEIKRIQDNLVDSLLIETNDNIYIYNYVKNKKYNHYKIQIEFNNKKIVKQIDSFDQNNILIANKLRKYVLSLCKNNYDLVLGIGGEYYLYFLFINANKYIGISNHKTIINDANYNIPYSVNFLVDYNNYNSLPKVKANLIILNLFNIHINVIKYLNDIKFDKLIIISCSLPENKLLLLKKNFKIITINTFSNLNGFIKVFQLVKLNFLQNL